MRYVRDPGDRLVVIAGDDDDVQRCLWELACGDGNQISVERESVPVLKILAAEKSCIHTL